MSDLLNKILEANGMSNQQAKEDILKRKEDEKEEYRRQMAGAVTRLVVNDALREMQARKKIFDETKGETAE
ncbi:hypothetical protein UFOVP118_41 [uncultured Caudovirales phage]|uniref:Uncharacterized protein n=1 Tax=uncultured Caudovirales phage TaxID=2100421 RepID=A0A6J5L510_9CAUD|nr:hypothetical protein UFOVP118_41 [uncultured Caudovirales phage]